MLDEEMGNFRKDILVLLIPERRYVEEIGWDALRAFNDAERLHYAEKLCGDRIREDAFIMELDWFENALNDGYDMVEILDVYTIFFMKKPEGWNNERLNLPWEQDRDLHIIH